MKKLIIASVVVCAAIATQAAAFSWKSSGTSTKGVIYAGNTTKAYVTYGAADLYMFDAGTYDQATAFADIVAAKGTSGLKTANKVAESLLSTQSKITTTAFDYGSSGGKYDFYFVAVLDKDNFYVSSTINSPYPSVGTTTIEYADLNTNSKTTLQTSAGYKGAGFYHYEAVPEPFSGALALLGMGAIALRRKMKKAKKA